MKCKKCNNEATKYSKYTNGDFCSKECARGFATLNEDQGQYWIYYMNMLKDPTQQIAVINYLESFEKLHDDVREEFKHLVRGNDLLWFKK